MSDAAELCITPVNTPCTRCRKPISEGDQGFMVPWARHEHDVEYLPVHRGCFLLEVLEGQR